MENRHCMQNLLRFARLVYGKKNTTKNAAPVVVFSLFFSAMQGTHGAAVPGQKPTLRHPGGRARRRRIPEEGGGDLQQVSH
ncbi:exported hypothetical protein [Burkholderiales bacterium]|nr:exported hypothetical protein [Burkholderiales bacterium]